jgi:macrolide transport system ATP-binding/permease protein
MSSRKSSRRSADDFVEEIRSHLALEADELEASGVAKEEAERRARASFGSVAAARERFNLRGRILWLDDLLRDVRFGIRMLLRNPALSIVAVLTLAIGIGACATAFTWINGILLQPLSGVADPMRLVTL